MIGMTFDAKKLLGKLVASKKPGGDAVVCYSAEYALHVHENLEAFHAIGQAKFLTGPAKKNAKKYSQLAKDLVAKGYSLQDAVYYTCLQLQADSQELCPVRTGFLKGSAYTRRDA